jgi:hypothetical protein
MSKDRHSLAPLPPRLFRPGTAVWLLLPLPLLAGCHNATAPNGGWLRASVMDVADTTVRTDYQGTGDFHVGKDPAWGVSVAFQLSSRGTGASAGQTLLLARPGAGRPAPGRYMLAPLTENDGTFSGFTAYYVGGAESFTTLSGEVDIEQSSDGLVAGTFHITAVQCCRSDPADMAHDWCVGPNTITPGAKQVEITGSFAAGPETTGPIQVWP